MTTLKLGILGLSPGNGHPYSWSAICNGYDVEKMAECPFPVIPEYLSKQHFPEDQLKDVQVTHIWTQDKTMSQDVAAAAYIDTIVDDYTDMIGQVDAVLLARDDAENHLEMSAPFLKAGLPIYIDKPLAFDLKTAHQIFDLEQRPHQIFTASALGFAPELSLTDKERQAVGTITAIKAMVVKDWLKYSVHIIDPVLKLIDSSLPIVSVAASHEGDKHTVEVIWADGISTTFKTLGATSAPISIEVIGTKGSQTLTFVDTYRAFKLTLKKFIEVVRGNQNPPTREFALKVVEIIDRGNQI